MKAIPGGTGTVRWISMGTDDSGQEDVKASEVVKIGITGLPSSGKTQTLLKMNLWFHSAFSLAALSTTPLQGASTSPHRGITR